MTHQNSLRKRRKLWAMHLNSPRSIYQYSNMAPRLSGQSSIFGVVFFVFESLLGIERQQKLKKLQFWPGVSKTKTPKTKTRRPKTYENEDLLRKRRPLTKRRPPTKTKTPYENEDPLRKRRPTKTKTRIFFCLKRNNFLGNEIISI